MLYGHYIYGIIIHQHKPKKHQNKEVHIMMGSPDGFGAQLTPGIPWASGLEIANPRLMRTTMCRTTTVTGILNNVSCDGAKHHVEATWNKGFMSMLLPSKKRGHGNGDKNKHDKTIQE
jgi:hypothetical protein